MLQPQSSKHPPTESRRWQAVVNRDGNADGRFVYAVKTTGVYCRPSCGAKSPHRENVVFYATAAEAERAGFRACKRCRPRGASLHQHRATLVASLCREIERSETPPTLMTLAEKAGLSPGHLQRLFKKITGLSPKRYADAHRAGRLREALASNRSVTDAIFEAGFGSNSRFYEKTDQWLGMPARDYRSGGKGTRIRFAVGQCSMGAILVAASGKGVCAIFLGDDPDILLRDLQDRFPRAQLSAGGAGFEHWVAQVVGFVEAPRIGLDLPLDIRGTAFQQRVWEALQAVPAGQTLSYADLAARIGAPGSARAVARACAANPLAVAIPCHRVVRADGKLSGYRWGIERKRQLLDRETCEPGDRADLTPQRCID